MGGALCRSVPAWPEDGLFDTDRTEIVSEKVERSSPSTVAPPQNLCPDGSVGCQEPAPTMVIVIAGLCVMLFLIAVALVLLFYSYYKYRRQTRVELDNENESVLVTIDRDEVSSEADDNYDVILLVLMPGEEEPVYFARRSPLFEEELREAVVREVMDTILGTVIVECEQAESSEAVIQEINRVVEELVAESSLATTIQEELNGEEEFDNRDEAESRELAVATDHTETQSDEFLNTKLEPSGGVNREEELNNRGWLLLQQKPTTE